MSREDPKTIEITGEIVHETDMAILFWDGGGDREENSQWLPKSQIEITDRHGETVEVTMPEWLAEAKGLV